MELPPAYGPAGASPCCLAASAEALRGTNDRYPALERPMEGGVVREDRRRLYPLIDGIPILLADEAIALEE